MKIEFKCVFFSVQSQKSYISLSTTLGTESGVMQGSIAEVQNNIRQLESVWKDLQSEHDRIEILLEKAEEELRHQERGGAATLSAGRSKEQRRVTLKDTLTEQIRDEKKRSEQLIKVKIIL